MKTLARELDEVLGLDPAAAILEFEKSWLTRGAIADATRQVEDILAPYAPGARVGVMVRNRPASIPAILACATAGRCLVVLNPVAPDQRFAEDLNSVDVEVVIGSARDWDRPGVIAAARRAGPLCIQLDDDLTVRIRARSDRPPQPVAAYPDVALEMLTSGTTGRPKRVPIRREAMESAALATLNFESGRGRRRRGAVQIGGPAVDGADLPHGGVAAPVECDPVGPPRLSSGTLYGGVLP